MIGKVTLGTALVGVLFSGAASAEIIEVTTITQTSENLTRASTSDPYVPDGVADAAVNANGFGGVSIGQRRNGGTDVLSLFRTSLFFELPDIPTGQVVESATLSVSYRSDNVFSGLYPAVDVFHSVTDNAAIVNPSLHFDSDFVDTGEDILDVSSMPSTGYISVDVTDQVIADYANDTSAIASYFRLQALNGIFDDPISINEQRYLIRSKTSDSGVAPPILEITFVPEPGSLALLSLGGLMLVRRRK